MVAPGHTICHKQGVVGCQSAQNQAMTAPLLLEYRFRRLPWGRVTEDWNGGDARQLLRNVGSPSECTGVLDASFYGNCSQA